MIVFTSERSCQCLCDFCHQASCISSHCLLCPEILSTGIDVSLVRRRSGSVRRPRRSLNRYRIFHKTQSTCPQLRFRVLGFCWLLCDRQRPSSDVPEDLKSGVVGEKKRRKYKRSNSLCCRKHSLCCQSFQACRRNCPPIKERNRMECEHDGRLVDLWTQLQNKSTEIRIRLPDSLKIPTVIL